MFNLSPDQENKIRELVHDRRMIQAMATYRLFTGVGLREAKEVITTMFHDDPLGSSRPIQKDELSSNG